MLKYVFYAICYFFLTMLIQFVLHRWRKNHNKGPYKIWAGPEIVVILCIVGILEAELVYFAAIIGYLTADMIGGQVGWH